jgi:hypothetical protein
MHRYRFTVELQGVSFENKLSFATISPLIRNATLEQVSPNVVSIEILKTRSYPDSIALQEATLEVEELLDRLALLDNHRVVSCQYTGYIDDAGTLHDPVRARMGGATLLSSFKDPASYYSQDRLKPLFCGRLNPGLARLHRTAQGMPNGVGKFLLLYGALQVLHGETQVKVDEYLLAKRPDMLMVHGKHRSETIVSHLRNLIAHPSNDIDIQTITRQAETYCPMLSELVRAELVSGIRA